VRGALLVGDFRFCALLLFQFDEEDRAGGLAAWAGAHRVFVLEQALGCPIGAGSIFNGGAGIRCPSLACTAQVI
jgi:hypothetical protein